MENKGFTLLEITVVISIIALLSGILLAYYRGGEKQFALQRSTYKLAQDLRTAQEMAMSSRKFEDAFPKGGYGIYFRKYTNSYILFADCNDNNTYDETGSAISCEQASANTPYPEKIQTLSLERGMKITDLSPASQENTLQITFFPPDPTITINPSANTALINLGFDGQSKIVEINTVGLIDIH